MQDKTLCLLCVAQMNNKTTTGERIILIHMATINESNYGLATSKFIVRQTILNEVQISKQLESLRFKWGVPAEHARAALPGVCRPTG